ncbi:MAG: UDP-N-acetylmuramate--L-alanine ligase [Clostridia bacterium]|nr:UDP-N-acetylmuramate--L-alanine ligase [Clostridia bacterium]
MNKISSRQFSRIYFLGIAGINMSALAKHCVLQGICVEGSDVRQCDETNELEKFGIKVNVGSSENYIKNFNPSHLVYTSAIKEDNPELIWAMQNDVKILKRSEFLGLIVSNYAKSVGVSGCHGKTTTSAMLSSVCDGAKNNPTVFIGGIDQNFSNYKKGDGGLVIVEACEYQKNFLDIKPTISVILNVDYDHMDSYSNMQELIDAFNKFSNTEYSVVNGDDQNCAKLIKKNTITFGLSPACVVRGANLFCEQGKYSFDYYYDGRKQTRISLNVQGIHNVYNALSVCAVANILNIPIDVLKGKLQSFSNVKRRMEDVGEYNGKKIIADYAHHPKEINAILNITEKEENTFYIFQPHTYSRTRYLMEEFVSVLSSMDNVCIYKTYPAREEYDALGDGRYLYKKIKRKTKGKCSYVKNYEALKRKIKRLPKKYVKVMFLGAGDIYDLANRMVGENKNNKKFKKTIAKI